MQCRSALHMVCQIIEADNSSYGETAVTGEWAPTQLTPHDMRTIFQSPVPPCWWPPLPSQHGCIAHTANCFPPLRGVGMHCFCLQRRALQAVWSAYCLMTMQVSKSLRLLIPTGATLQLAGYAEHLACQCPNYIWKASNMTHGCTAPCLPWMDC
jgi:hypothetical protein